MTQGRVPYPLAGLRVVDFSRVLSGPYAGRILADLGADVVKVEPPDGDLSRLWGEIRHGLSGFYTQHNCGKRNVCIDLKAPDGPALARELIASADVVIENFTAGVAERLGLGWETLRADNPDLVMLSISGFGQDGPDSHRPAFAPVIHAETGLIERQARSDEARPADPMLSIADLNAGLHGVVAILAALRVRDAGGGGNHIDLSMLHSALHSDDYAHHYLDGSPVARLGGRIWDAPGGPILVSADLRHTWRQLSATAGLTDGLPRTAALEEKLTVRRALIAEWVASHSDRKVLQAALDEANLVHADIRTPEAAFRDAGRVDPPLVREIDDRGGGQRRIIRSPYRFSNAGSDPGGPAPYRGEHNAEVLTGWAGIRPDVIAALTTAGVLQQEPFTSDIPT